MNHTILLANLHQTAKRRPPGYVQDVLAHATNVTETTYDLSDEHLAKLILKYDPPIPRENWPLTMRLLARRAIPADTGLGDTLSRQFGILGELYKRSVKALGYDCGCTARQAHLNRKFPLK